MAAKYLPSFNKNGSQINLVSHSRGRGGSASTMESSIDEQPEDCEMPRWSLVSHSSSSDLAMGSEQYQSVPPYHAPGIPVPPELPPRPRCISDNNGYITPTSAYAYSPHTSSSEASSPSRVDMRPPSSRTTRGDRSYARRSTANQRICKRRTLVVVNLVALLISSASLVLSALCFVNYVVPYLEGDARAKDSLEACLPCHELGDEQVILDLFPDTEQGQQECCARTAGQISSVLNLLMKESKKTKYELPSGPKYQFSPVTAHIALRPFTDKRDNQGAIPSKNNDYGTKLNQDMEQTPHEHARGVTWTDNKLHIEHSGLYYVYSSVYFKSAHEKRLCSNNSPWTLSVNVYRHNVPSRNSALIKNIYKWSGGQSEAHQTSYSGGVFELQKGDVIHVTVCNEKVVSFGGDTTYVGLVMLDSQQDLDHTLHGS